MKLTPLLTIAIPTYKRCKWLEISLPEILNQVKEIEYGLIEVLVSENCGKDGTWDFLLSFEKYDFLRIHQNEDNIGAENNFYLLHEMARGKYFWLVGDDDFLLKNSIARLVDALKTDADCYLLNFGVLKENMALRYYSVINQGEDKTYSNINKFLDLTPHMVMGFISAWVCKKEFCFRVNKSEYFKFSKFGLSFMLDRYINFSYISSGMYLAEPFLMSKEISRVEIMELSPNNTFFGQYVSGSGELFKYLERHYFPLSIISSRKSQFLFRIVLKRIIYEKAIRIFRCSDAVNILWKYYRSNLVFWVLCMPLIFFPGVGFFARILFKKRLSNIIEM